MLSGPYKENITETFKMDRGHCEHGTLEATIAFYEEDP